MISISRYEFRKICRKRMATRVDRRRKATYANDFDAHMAYLEKKGERRTNRANARIELHKQAVILAKNASARKLARKRLRCAEKWLVIVQNRTADVIARYIKYYREQEASKAPTLPLLPY